MSIGLVTAQHAIYTTLFLDARSFILVTQNLSGKIVNAALFMFLFLCDIQGPGILFSGFLYRGRSNIHTSLVMLYTAAERKKFYVVSVKSNSRAVERK